MSPPASPDPPQRPTPVAVAGLLLIVLGSWGFRLHLIDQQMPYPGHMDERPLNARALKVATSGDLNPGWFEYPSLPIYLSSIGMIVGSGIASLYTDVTGVADIGRVGHPFYSRPDLMIYPRALFMTLGVLCLLLCALLARRLTGDDLSLWTAPLLCLLSPSLLSLTWSYVNVDTCATFFGILAAWYAVAALPRYSLATKVFIPALICGAATASKYNSGLIGVPFLIAIAAGARPTRTKLLHAALLGVLALAAFVLFVPYSVLSWDRFSHDVLLQMRHYREGHRGYEAEPGWDQLGYYVQLLVGEFGPGAIGLSVVGLVSGLKRDGLRVGLVASFPVLMILYMSSNRTHFVRTVLPVFPFVAVLATLGAHHAVRFLAAHLQRSRLQASPRLAAVAAALVLAATVVPGAPLSKLRAQYDPPTDSRKLALQWIGQNVPEGALLLHPKRLDWDTRPLQGSHAFKSYNAKSRHGLSKALKRTAGRKRYLVYPNFGFDARRRGGPGAARRAHEAHQSVPGLERLAHFGSQEVAINRAPSFPRDPELDIASID